MKGRLAIKRDKYKSARGGWSRILKITCAKCHALITSYQKDGPGELKRMYLDRMSPSSTKKALACPSCKELLGTLYVYPKEKRLAYRLFQDSVRKKIIKANT